MNIKLDGLSYLGFILMPQLKKATPYNLDLKVSIETTLVIYSHLQIFLRAFT